MKQTNNAIKFLMAQYRAIFKNAYFKGLAAAAVLTAGLAAGSAQAAVNGEGVTAQGYWQLGSINNTDSGVFHAGQAGDVTGNVAGAINKGNQTVVSGSLTIQPVTGADITGSVSYTQQDQSNGNAVGAVGVVNTGDITVTNSFIYLGKAGSIDVYVENNIYAGYARAKAGSATVSHSDAVINLANNINGTNGITAGARVSALHNALADTNSLSITGTSESAKLTNWYKNKLYGGYAETIANSTGEFVAQNNTVTIENVQTKTDGSPDVLDIAGGYAYVHHDTASAQRAYALYNTVTLTGVDFEYGSGSSIAANRAGQTKASDTANTDVRAIGSENTGLTITNANLTDITIYGGSAIALVKGSAEASANNITITNTKATAGGIVGGYAQASGGNAFANKNTVNIVSNDDVIASITDNNGIYGGWASLSGSITNQQSAEASENKLTIGNKVTVSGASIDDYIEIVGGKITADNSGSSSVANNNTVELAGDATNVAIYGGMIRYNGTANNNAVVISGEINNGTVYGAYASGSSTVGSDTVYSSLSGNSVTIKSGATVNNTHIFAAVSDQAKASGTNNDVTIEAGAKVIGADIYGGQGSDSVIDIAGTYTANKSSNAIVSDVINISGQININQGTDLALRGYLTDNKFTANTFNPGIGTITSDAIVANNGKLFVYNATTVEQGALLSAQTEGAVIRIENNPSVIEDDTTGRDYKFVTEEGATLTISESQVNDYLTENPVTIPGIVTATDNDRKGAIEVTSGGTLDFGTSATLSNFNIVTNANTAGAIKVDSSLGSGLGSIFKADTLNIEHAFASNNSTAANSETYKLKGTDTNGIVLEAGTLNLGTTSLAGEKTADITFGYAEVSSEVNFANGAISDKETDKYDGYRLADGEIRLDAKQEVKDEIGRPDNHFHALTGTINGEFRLQGTTGAQGQLVAINGHWTANDDVTLASGGTIKVGDTLSVNEHFTKDAFVTDTSLTLNNALSVDLTDIVTGDDNRVQVIGNGQYYNLSAFGSEDAHLSNQHLALLDLRAGINLIEDDASDSYQSTATFYATQGGVILVDGSNLSDLLAASSATDKGINFSIDSSAQLVAEGDVNADFGDFGNGSTDINLTNDGYFVADSLTLNNDDTPAGATLPADATYIDSEGNNISFGGNVQVKELTITDSTRTQKASGSTVTSPYASQVDVISGNIEIAKSLTVQNDTLNISGARFEFATDSVAGSGAITVNNVKVAQKGATASDVEIAFTNGIWDATGTTFTLNTGAGLQVGGDDGEDINDLDTEAVVNINRVVANAGSNIDVRGDGNLTISTVDFSKLAANSAAVTVRGNLTIEGDASYTVSGSTTPTRNGVLFGGAGSIVVENNGHLTFGTDATTGAIIANGNHSGDTVTLVEGFTQIQNNGGEVELGLASGTMFSAEAVLDLKTKLFTSNSLNSGILVNGGVLNIGDAGFQGIELTDDGDGTYTATWEQMKNWSDIETNADVTNSRLTKTNVTGIKVSDQVRGHYGALRMDASAASNAQVDLYGHTSLRFAEGNNGYFISNADGSAALGAKVAAGKSLTLIDGGKIGAITLADGNNGDTELTVQGTGETIIASINGDATDVNNEDSVVYINGVTNVTADIADVNLVEVTSKLTANTIDVQELAALTGSVTADTITVEEGTVFGGTVTAKNFTYETTATDDRVVEAFNGGKLVVTDTLKVANDGKVFVGYELTDADRDLLALEGYTNVTGTGYLETNVLDLNGGTLYVDPAYGEDTSLAAIKTFKADKSFTVANNVGNADGNIFVGKNAAVGIGTDLAGLQEAIDAYQEGGSLSADKYGSIMYLNGQAKLAANTLVALDSDINIDTDSQFRQVREYTENGSTLLADMGLGDKTALIMSTNAFADKDGNKTGTAITFDKDRAVINNEGSVIILQGSFATGDKLNFFNDKGNDGIKLVGQNLEFFSENGFLKGVIEVGENVGLAESLEVDRPHAYNIMHEASDPVVESLIAYGNRNVTATTPAPDTPEQDQSGQQPSVDDPNADTGDGTTTSTSGSSVAWTELTPATSSDSKDQTNDNGADTTVAANNSTFLDAVITTSHGAPAEAAARLAIYGGAVQAAMAATSSTTDAIAARMGVGNTANITMANNGQGAALWLAPVYKTHDSDSFDSQGLDYGVDLNLYGVALGADFEFMPGLKAGVMFNVGSGDADGQGNAAANNTSNDFDYWGAAIYGNYTYDALSVTADVSYTAVDNDLEATTGMDQFTKLESSTDTTAISLGVTAKYTFDFGGVEVAPHAGLRYTNIDLDDYSIKSNGESIADYSADKVNIFSIPVGVTFAKEFTGDAWTVKPSLDLTLTGNFGDDDISGDVSWTGVDGLVTPVSSEYMDDFTYGATLGIEAASTSGFSLGLGVNYTGSSNVDEFGVNANARFVF